MPHTGILKYKTRDGEWDWKFGVEEIKASHCTLVVEHYDHKGAVHPETIVGTDGTIPEEDDPTDVVTFDESHITPQYGVVVDDKNGDTVVSTEHKKSSPELMNISSADALPLRLEKHKHPRRFSAIPDCTIISLAFAGHSRQDGWYRIVLNTPAFLLNDHGVTVDVIRSQH
jgi:hypothetical protein